MTRLMALIAAVFLFATPSLAQTLTPVDQSAKDPKLAELIATLIKACDEKNFKPFEAVLLPDAVSSFGGDGGVQEFKEFYGIDSLDTTFYVEFKEAVMMGGAFMIDGTYYGAPYVHAIWPNDRDGFDWTAAVGDRTLLYAKPDGHAKTLADVTHQLLERIAATPGARNATPEGWLHVKAGEMTGYVKDGETRSPLDHRAVFQKIGNRWRLQAFVSGD